MGSNWWGWSYICDVMAAITLRYITVWIVLMALAAQSQRKCEILRQLPHDFPGCDESTESFLWTYDIRGLCQFKRIVEKVNKSILPDGQMHTPNAANGVHVSLMVSAMYRHRSLSAAAFFVSFGFYRPGWDSRRVHRIVMSTQVTSKWPHKWGSSAKNWCLPWHASMHQHTVRPRNSCTHSRRQNRKQHCPKWWCDSRWSNRRCREQSVKRKWQTILFCCWLTNEFSRIHLCRIVEYKNGSHYRC